MDGRSIEQQMRDEPAARCERDRQLAMGKACGMTCSALSQIIHDHIPFRPSPFLQMELCRAVRFETVASQRQTKVTR
jgi:hypothetical protein